MRPSRSWVPITFEGLLILSHSQRRIFRCVPHSMPNRLAGYLHTLSSYIRSREQRETISGGFFSMRSNGSSALSHTRALSKGKEETCVIDPSELRGLSVSFTVESDGKEKKAEVIPLHIEVLIAPHKEAEGLSIHCHENGQKEEAKSINGHVKSYCQLHW